MRIDKINNTNFQAGKLRLSNLTAENLRNLDALREIAEKRNIDISIYKKDGGKYLKNYDMYFVTCTKVFKTCFNVKNPETYHSLGLTIHPKKIVPETLSENVYNVVLETTENVKKIMLAQE